MRRNEKVLPQRKRRCTAMCRAIRIAYSSLSSHMSYAIECRQRDRDGTVGDELFNARTIREYAEIILICSWELEYLNLKRRNARTKKEQRTTIQGKSQRKGDH